MNKNNFNFQTIKLLTFKPDQFSLIWLFLISLIVGGFAQPTFAENHRAIASVQSMELAFNNNNSNSSVLKKGSRGSLVIELQTTLQVLGYYQGKITGFYGTATQAAVKQFQTDQGLKPDGIVGSKTQVQLKKEYQQHLQKPSESTDSTLPVRGDLRQSSQQPDQPSENLSFLKEGFSQAIALLENPQKAINSAPQPSKPTVKSPEKMTLIKTISGGLSPKSVVHSGSGLFFAQNMMYQHTITIYDRKFNLIKRIPDSIKLSDFGYSKFQGTYKGSPVEASFSPDGKYAYVSNYKMYGKGFNRPGTDRCSPAGRHDNSFLYQINTETFNIENVIQVGSVPKYTAVTPDNRFVLVSNWCSWDLSVVDLQKGKEIKRLKLGRYPRGIAIDPQSKFAYIAVMGSSNLAKINLKDFSVDWLNNVGRSPRHLNIDPQGKYLYLTLNSEGRVGKIDLSTNRVIKKISTGNMPRSMVLSEDGQWMYVVNYGSNTVSKVRTQDMKVIQNVKVNHHPIGITYDPKTQQVWVACYSGSIMVFQD